MILSSINPLLDCLVYYYILCYTSVFVLELFNIFV